MAQVGMAQVRMAQAVTAQAVIPQVVMAQAVTAQRSYGSSSYGQSSYTPSSYGARAKHSGTTKVAVGQEALAMWVAALAVLEKALGHCHLDVATTKNKCAGMSIARVWACWYSK